MYINCISIAIAFLLASYLSSCPVIASPMNMKYANMIARKPLRILVFGGSGFVGSLFVKKALEHGHEVVALSRRGKPNDWTPIDGIREPRWLQCDVTKQDELLQALAPEPSFDVYVHAVGLLFDQGSGFANLNKYASGSGSVPAMDASYDLITRQSAFHAIDFALQQHPASTQSSLTQRPTLIFLSAAEAGWNFKCPVTFLERYLLAKRAVEQRLLSLENTLRPVVLRPSIIWSPERPQGFPVVAAFYTGNFLQSALGLRGLVDRPITVQSLTQAMIAAVELPNVEGILQWEQMEEIAKQSSQTN
jgi:nucleoside-diphosphate-sugar epimerase